MDRFNWIKEFEEYISQGNTPKESQAHIREWMRGDNLGRLTDIQKEYMRLRIRAYEAEQAFQKFKKEAA